MSIHDTKGNTMPDGTYTATKSELRYALWALENALEQIATDEPVCEEDYLAEGRNETRQILRIAKRRIEKKLKGAKAK